MKRLTFALVLLVLLIGCSTLCLSTTVVGIRTPTAVVIGADSKLGTGDATRNLPNVCKIKVTNNVVFANAGLLSDSGTKFSLEDEAKSFMAREGLFLDRVKSFEVAVIPKLERITSALQITAPKVFTEKIDGRNVTETIFVTETQGDLKFLVRRFVSKKGSGGKIGIVANEYRSSSKSGFEGTALGRPEAVVKAFNFTIFDKGLEQGVKYLIQVAIDHEPDLVGPPISLVRVEKGKIEWKERGLCKQ